MSTYDSPPGWPEPGTRPPSWPAAVPSEPPASAGVFPVQGARPARDSRPRGRWGTPLDSPVRFVAAALLTVLAVAHLLVLQHRFERSGGLGALYLFAVASAVGTAVVLAWRDSRLGWLLAGVGTEIALVALVLGHLLGPAAATDDTGRWTAPLGVLTVVVEAAVLGLVGWTLTRHGRPAPSRPASRFPLVAGLVTLQLGAVATFAAASVPGASEPGTAPAALSGPSTSGYWASVAGASSPSGTVRTYYIGADEVVWDYAPTGRNQITGQPFDDTANVFVKTGRGRIGSKYLKCLYEGYTDGTFATRQRRPAAEAYLGTLGPVIHAAVGDTIKVVFRNTCRFGVSVHPHGVFYDKASEGAPYADGTSGSSKLDDAVPTGGTHTYTWKVPERAGPGPHDGTSVMWMYHSHTDEIGDTYAGLMGPMVITAAAQARPDGTPKDVDRELFVMFAVMNEGASPYLHTNVERFARKPYADQEDEGFAESNLMHGINGYVYGNQPMITIARGQHVRWYVMGMGTEVDLHTPHWHGNDVVVHGMRMDVVDLLPASMVIADMAPDNAGVWLFHCHVNDHLSAGMVTRYTVTAN